MSDRHADDLADAGTERQRWSSLCTDLMNALWSMHPAPQTDAHILELSRRQDELEQEQQGEGAVGAQEETPAWMQPLFRDVMGSADQELIRQMLALGEDVSDREHWVRRRLELFGVAQAMLADEAKRLALAWWAQRESQ